MVAPYFFASDRSIFPATTSGSLFAIRIFLLTRIDFKVGSNPAIPGIARIEISDFLNLKR